MMGAIQEGEGAKQGGAKRVEATMDPAWMKCSFLRDSLRAGEQNIIGCASNCLL